MRVSSVEPDARLKNLAGGDVDWCYAAQVRGPVSADAIEWARATFRGAPLLLRLFLIAGWRMLLLEGAARSDGARVLGWPVVRSTPEAAVLQRRSRLGIHATLLFATGPGCVTFSSAMVFTNGLGRVVWVVVAPIHRWAVRVALGHARAL